jgi:Membrane transport protein
MIGILADALVPVFAGLLIGYVAGLRKVVDNNDARTLITFVMSFAVPCALFTTRSVEPPAIGMLHVRSNTRPAGNRCSAISGRPWRATTVGR